jgi:hypothetical protein
MEADWSVEIGPELPTIDAAWDGFVDLQTSPRNIENLNEAKHFPLREALLALNEEISMLFTTKCDAWTLSKDEIDPDEFGASASHSCAGFACYIDIVERDIAHFASFAFQEQRVRELTTRLRAMDLPCGRVDFVLRSAVIKRQSGYGLTLYTAGCGSDAAEAYTAWQSVLAIAVAATIATASNPPHAGE